jgi:hypothetical protein
MKMPGIIYALTLVVTLCTLTQYVSAQKLREDKIDEFTSDTIRSTHFEVFCMNMKFMAQIAVTKINNRMALEVKLSTEESLRSIEKDEEFMIKLKNGQVVKLLSNEFVQACKGCAAKGLMGSGADGIHAFYRIEPEQIQKLIESPVEKIRIYTHKGYMEGLIKESKAEIIQQQINLVSR